MLAAAIEDVTGSCDRERTPAAESEVIIDSEIQDDHRQLRSRTSPALESRAIAGSGIWSENRQWNPG